MGDTGKTHEEMGPDDLHYVELLKHARDVILIIQDDVVKYANRQLEGSGYQLDEVVGHPVVGLPGLSHQIVDHYRSRVAGESPPSIYKSKVVAKDGHEIDVEISATMAQYQGKPSVVAVLRDISDRERISRELGESEQRFRCLSEAAFEGIAIHKDGRIVEVNQAFCELAERDREDVVGKPILEFAAPKHRELVMKNVAAGYEKPYEVESLNADGSRRHVELIGKNILYKGQRARVTAIRDISERKKLQAQIQRAQKLESLGVLAGGIAHDFNNLLMGVLGNASLALHVLPSHSPAREYVQEINRVGQHAAELTNQMLAYSGGGRYVVEPLHLSALIEEMGSLLQVSVSKKVTLRYNLRGGDLPYIEADASQVRQVVMNLVINASEASAEDGGVVTVRTDLVRVMSAADEGYITGDQPVEGACVLFEVSDSGCGMEPATMERIFDPFFTTKFTGRGLGLAAVLGIVRGHHGAIRVQSSPGEGCQFEILFPARGQLGADASLRSEASVTSERGGKVLLVDDDPTARVVAQKMLESLGFTVLAANDGCEGVRVFKEHADEVGLVLLDKTMPVMSGEEALVELKRIRPDVRVILSSGYEEKEATEQIVKRSDLAGFIQKPYQLEQLDAIIRRALT